MRNEKERQHFLLVISVVVFFSLLHIGLSCNEAVCASIVSKCMLTQSCKCDLKNASCSRDCFHCLDYLYTDCCSCVEMCPKPNDTDSKLSQKSHVEDLQEPYPDLFQVLTEEKDRLLRWISFTYPIQLSFVHVTQEKDIKMGVSEEKPSVYVEEEEKTQVNCTVAFMSQCMSWNKCKSSCRSMGASSYRWFHDGCCQCVGAMCINYGINESRCLQCPLDKDEMPVEEAVPPVSREEDNDSLKSAYIEEEHDMLSVPKVAPSEQHLGEDLQKVDTF